MLDLKGKVALVIGLGQSGTEGWGIGAACAVLFARQGAVIFGGNRTIASTLKTREAIEAEGGQCDVVATDATSSESVKALVDACVAKHGRVDILLTNVGQSQPGDAATMSEEVWDSQMDINLKSVYLACHHVLPLMEKQGSGSVVCVSSIAGMRYIGKPQVAYNTTKAAIMQFVKATAVVYAPKGVRLNTVVPGLMDTPYTKSLAQRFPAAGGYEEFCKTRDGQVPMGKMGDAWDVANAALFLVSDEASPVLGELGDADGGKGHAAADLVRRRHNLERLADLGGAQVTDVHVHTGARRLAQIPRRDGQAGGEVDDGGRHGAVERPSTVHVVGFQHKSRRRTATSRVDELDRGEQKRVDGAVGEEAVDDALDVGGSRRRYRGFFRGLH
ncbi:hypothetical protein AK830_g3913 [Neonectria ditissima]|uniref:Oxidoreductase n=1 Tax=Neonectria ditissima TaxID=78410 RepID=A0A0N8H7T1_9HYPO|nr:hypothetical protein AK830_g3913 [Neonectria ditissima]